MHQAASLHLQRSAILEFGTFLQCVAINSDGSIRLHASFQVLGLGDVEPHAIRIKSVHPLLHLMLELLVGLICETDIIGEQRPRVWSLDLVCHHRVHTCDKGRGKRADPWWTPMEISKGGDMPAVQWSTLVVRW